MSLATVPPADTAIDVPVERLRVTVRGAVQGVGFRPFIYRLATNLGLAGWVNNSSQGVLIEVEGVPERLRQFLLRIEAEKPPRSFIQSLEAALLDPAGYTSFTIRHSDPSGPKTALVLLHEIYGPALFAMDDLAPLGECSPQERAIIKTMLERQLNAPRTSSAGRLFDAVASLLGLRQRARFEGQAAMELEWAQDGHLIDDVYPFELRPQAEALVADWEPMVRAILDDLGRQVPAGRIAALFHNTLAELIIAVARLVGQPRVVLSGGCFQNAALTERAVRRLQVAGFRPYWHQRIPPTTAASRWARSSRLHVCLSTTKAAKARRPRRADSSGEKEGLRELPSRTPFRHKGGSLRGSPAQEPSFHLQPEGRDP